MPGLDRLVIITTLLILAIFSKGAHIYLTRIDAQLDRIEAAVTAYGGGK